MSTSYVDRNPHTVRATGTIASTSFIPHNVPIAVGQIPYTLVWNPVDNGLEYLTFPWPRDRFTRLISWADPSHDGDVTVTAGTGAGILPVPAPDEESWRGTIVINRRSTQENEVEGDVVFRANVSFLEITAQDIVVHNTVDSTAGLVDAQLPPWASLSRGGVNAIVKPWLSRLSEPMTIVTAQYPEWQQSRNLLKNLRKLKPGGIAILEIPSPKNSYSSKVLILQTTIEWGAARKQAGLPPIRTVAGLDLSTRVVPQEVDVEATPVGTDGASIVVSVSNPNPANNIYVRVSDYHKPSETPISLAVKRQAENVVFAATGLTANRVYVAEASLDAQFRTAARALFRTELDTTVPVTTIPRLESISINGEDLTSFMRDTVNYNVKLADFDEDATTCRVEAVAEDVNEQVVVNPSGDQEVVLGETQRFQITVGTAGRTSTYNVIVEYPEEDKPDPNEPDDPDAIIIDEPDVPPLARIYSAPDAEIRVGDTYTILWSVSSNADTISVTADGVEISTANRGHLPYVASSTSAIVYSVTASNDAGSVTESVTVTPKARITPIELPEIVYFRTNRIAVDAGTQDTAVLSWDTTRASRVTLQAGSGTEKVVAARGTENVSPDATTVYSLRAYRGEGGNQRQVRRQVTVVATVRPPVIEQFTTNKTLVSAGESALLTYRIFGATEATINGTAITLPTGSHSVTPSASSAINVYTLVAKRKVGTATAEVSEKIRIGVDRSTAPLPSPPVINVSPDRSVSIIKGESTELRWGTTGIGVTVKLYRTQGVTQLKTLTVPSSQRISVSPTETTVYRFVAENDGGTDEDTVTVIVGAGADLPTAELVVGADKKTISIQSGNSATLRWTTENAFSADITNVGFVPLPSGSIQVSPRLNTIYQLRVYNSDLILATDTVTIAVVTGTAPSAPRSFRARRVASGVGMTWSAPSNWGTGRIRRYRAEVNGRELFTGRISRSFIDTNPQPGSQTYKVYAVTEHGESLAAQSTVIVPSTCKAPDIAGTLTPSSISIRTGEPARLQVGSRTSTRDDGTVRPLTVWAVFDPDGSNFEFYRSTKVQLISQGHLNIMDENLYGPGRTGTFTYRVYARNECGTTTQDFTLRVNP